QLRGPCELAGSRAPLVPLDHFGQPNFEAYRRTERRHLLLQLGDVGVLAGAAVRLGAIELNLDLDAGELRELLDEVHQLDGRPAREVDRVAVDSAFGCEAEAECKV